MGNSTFVLTQGSDSQENRVTDGLVALYQFNQTSGNTIPDVSGIAPALDLTLDTTAGLTVHPDRLEIASEVRASSGGQGSATKVYDAVDATGSVTVEFWCRPLTTDQHAPGTTGPARMVTMSHWDPAQGTEQMNFMLGQGEFTDSPTRPDDHLRFRFRTDDPSIDDDGTPSIITDDGSIVAGELYHIVISTEAVEDGREMRMWLTRFGDAFDAQPTEQEFRAGDITSADAGAWVRDFALYWFNANDTGSFPRHWLGDAYLGAIYSKALTAGEVEQNFLAGPNGSTEIPDPILEWDTAATTVSEVDGSVALRIVSANGARSYDCSVNVTAGAGSTASAGTHYDFPAITRVTIPAGETGADFTVTLIHDGIEDQDYMVSLELEAPLSATLGTQQVHTLTMQDADVAPTIQFASGTSSHNRPSTVQIAASMDRPYFQDITVPLTVTGTAAGDATVGSLVFPQGSTSGQVQVATEDNGEVSNETVILTMGTPTPIGSVGVTDEHTITVEPALPANFQNSVTKGAITWTFDSSYQVGQFITGDWWVVAPTGLTVTSISPAPNNSQRRNGSVVNPPVGYPSFNAQDGSGPWAGALMQGFQYDWNNFSTGRFWNDIAAIDLPYSLDPGESLSSSWTRGPSDPIVQFLNGTSTSLSGVYEVQVLTCLDAVPPADAFRPPYAGSNKPLYRESDIDWARLPSLSSATNPAGNMRDNSFGSNPISDYVQYLANPQWFSSIDFRARGSHPGNNMIDDYHRDIHLLYAEVCALLAVSGDGAGARYTSAQARDLAIVAIQAGIDDHYHQTAQAADGSRQWDSSSFKPFMVFAGYMLNASDMLSPSYSPRYRGSEDVYNVSKNAGGCFQGPQGSAGWISDSPWLWRQKPQATHQQEQVDPVHLVNNGQQCSVEPGTSGAQWKSLEGYRRQNCPPYVGAALLMYACQARAAAIGYLVDPVQAWIDGDIASQAHFDVSDGDGWFRFVDRWMYEADQGRNAGAIARMASVDYNPSNTGWERGSCRFIDDLWDEHRASWSPAQAASNMRY